MRAAKMENWKKKAVTGVYIVSVQVTISCKQGIIPIPGLIWNKKSYLTLGLQHFMGPQKLSNDPNFATSKGNPRKVTWDTFRQSILIKMAILANLFRFQKKSHVLKCCYKLYFVFCFCLQSKYLGQIYLPVKQVSPWKMTLWKINWTLATINI